MIRRPPRSTLDRSSAASDVYKRQHVAMGDVTAIDREAGHHFHQRVAQAVEREVAGLAAGSGNPVSYTHLRAHETVLDLVCRLLLEKKKRKKQKKKTNNKNTINMTDHIVN